MNDANAHIGFNKFLASYIGVTVNELDTTFRLLSSGLRRLQTANIEADIRISLPPERSVNKAETKQKLEDMGPAQNAPLNAALANEGATGYDPQVQDVTNIQEGTIMTTPPPPMTTPAPPVTAGGMIALIVILCLLVFAGAFIAITCFVLRKRTDNNANTNKHGKSDTNADISGEIPNNDMDEHVASIDLRPRQFYINMPTDEVKQSF